MSTFLQQLVNGLSVGSIYALIALGYTMVYGTLGLINFAHGEVFMIGCYIGLYAAFWLGYDALAAASFSHLCPHLKVHYLLCLTTLIGASFRAI